MLLFICLFVCLFLRLLFALSHKMSTRGEAMFLLNYWYGFYFVGIVNFVSDFVACFLWFTENQNQVYDSLFVLDKIFNAHFLG